MRGPSVSAFGDPAAAIATLNEPWVVTDGGYLHGALAPGHSNLFETPIASRNLMLAHGAAVKRYREGGAHRIGLFIGPFVGAARSRSSPRGSPSPSSNVAVTVFTIELRPRRSSRRLPHRSRHRWRW